MTRDPRAIHYEDDSYLEPWDEQWFAEQELYSRVTSAQNDGCSPGSEKIAESPSLPSVDQSPRVKAYLRGPDDAGHHLPEVPF